jgi:hypothetical protein
MNWVTKVIGIAVPISFGAFLVFGVPRSEPNDADRNAAINAAVASHLASRIQSTITERGGEYVEVPFQYVDLQPDCCHFFETGFQDLHLVPKSVQRRRDYLGSVSITETRFYIDKHGQERQETSARGYAVRRDYTVIGSLDSLADWDY